MGEIGSLGRPVRTGSGLLAAASEPGHVACPPRKLTVPHGDCGQGYATSATLDTPRTPAPGATPGPGRDRRPPARTVSGATWRRRWGPQVTRWPRRAVMLRALARAARDDGTKWRSRE